MFIAERREKEKTYKKTLDKLPTSHASSDRGDRRLVHHHSISVGECAFPKSILQLEQSTIVNNAFVGVSNMVQLSYKQWCIQINSDGILIIL